MKFIIDLNEAEFKSIVSSADVELAKKFEQAQFEARVREVTKAKAEAREARKAGVAQVTKIG